MKLISEFRDEFFTARSEGLEYMFFLSILDPVFTMAMVGSVSERSMQEQGRSEGSGPLDYTETEKATDEECCKLGQGGARHGEGKSEG